MNWGFPTRESPFGPAARNEASWWKAEPAQIHLPCASLLPQRRASLLLSAVSLPLLLASCDFLVFAAPVPQKLVSVFQENGILFWPQFHHPMKTSLLPKGQLLLTKLWICSCKKLTMTNDRHFASLRDRPSSSYLILSSSWLSLSLPCSLSRSSSGFCIFLDDLFDLAGTTVISSESSPSYL